MLMQLTHDQSISLTLFEDFLRSDNAVFILSGAAGTGKTTLLKMFINILDKQHLHYALMAPTGRAALVLNDKTQCDATTIHRQIYSIDSTPMKIDDRWAFVLKQNSDPTNTIYFVDEASMIADVYQDNEFVCFGSGRVLYDLMAYCSPESTKRKIVFVGDNVQLPPIGQSFSPAMDSQYIQKEYNVRVQESVLNEVVRQAKESGVLANAHKIRQSLSDEVYNHFKIDNANDVFALDIANFKTRYKELVNEGKEKTMVITHSNSQALSFNKIIREILFGAEQQDVAPGDLLMITRNNYSNAVELFNGSIVYVQDVDSNIETKIAYVGQEQIELKFRKISLTYRGYHIDTYILNDFLMDKRGTLPLIQQKALWAHFEQRMAKRGIKPGDEEFRLHMKVDPYFNALQCKYGYASTCHKAQGGEWDTVIVNLDTFGGKSNAGFFRWAYTAMTRAKKQLLYMNSPYFSAIDQIKTKPIQVCPASKISYYTPTGTDWRDRRFESILRLSRYANLDCKESRAIQYQHRIAFTRDNEMCELSLWYNKNYYSNRIQTIKRTSEEFEQICIAICKESLYISTFSFQPKFPFQQELHNHIIEIAQEVGCGVTNVVQKEWSDIYYLKTDADAAYVEFFYNAKHIYSTAIPYSTQAEEDVVLTNFLAQL